MVSRIKPVRGIIRHLPDDDPRNPNHPNQRANWLAAMEKLGRQLAIEEWERLYGAGDNNDHVETSGRIYKIFKR
jgi:hypothetical protein